jgi:hypothetical protein
MIKNKNSVSQKMGRYFTTKQDCERFHALFKNTKTTKLNKLKVPL